MKAEYLLLGAFAATGLGWLLMGRRPKNESIYDNVVEGYGPEGIYYSTHPAQLEVARQQKGQPRATFVGQTAVKQHEMLRKKIWDKVIERATYGTAADRGVINYPYKPPISPSDVNLEALYRGMTAYHYTGDLSLLESGSTEWFDYSPEGSEGWREL
jgi:hypothetical protein